MKRELAIAVILPCMAAISPVAFGQASPPIRPSGPVRADDNNPPPPIPQKRIDEAMQKLREKEQARQEANPTTRPSTRPANYVTPTDPAAMRAEIMRLRRMVTQLQADNRSLRSRVVMLAGENPQLRQAVQDAEAAAQRAESASQQSEQAYQQGYPPEVIDRDYWPYWNNQVIVPNANPGQPTQQNIPAPGNAMNGARAFPNHNGPANVPQNNTLPAPTGGPNGQGGNSYVQPSQSAANATATINRNARNPGNANSAGRTGGATGQNTGGSAPAGGGTGNNTSATHGGGGTSGGNGGSSSPRR